MISSLVGKISHIKIHSHRNFIEIGVGNYTNTTIT